VFVLDDKLSEGKSLGYATAVIRSQTHQDKEILDALDGVLDSHSQSLELSIDRLDSLPPGEERTKAIESLLEEAKNFFIRQFDEICRRNNGKRVRWDPRELGWLRFFRYNNLEWLAKLQQELLNGAAG